MRDNMRVRGLGVLKERVHVLASNHPAQLSPPQPCGIGPRIFIQPVRKQLEYFRVGLYSIVRKRHQPVAQVANSEHLEGRPYDRRTAATVKRRHQMDTMEVKT